MRARLLLLLAVTQCGDPAPAGPDAAPRFDVRPDSVADMPAHDLLAPELATELAAADLDTVIDTSLADAATDAIAPPADAAADATEVSAPAVPQDPTQLPPAPFADVTAALGIDGKKVHGACVGVGQLDGAALDDFVIIEIANKEAKIHAVLLGGAQPKHVFSPFDTSELVPTTGCSLADMDSDGDLDLLAGGQAGAALYLGDGKGGFVNGSAQWLPYILDFATLTIAPADIDSDGDLDVLVGAGVTPVNTIGGPACGSMQCAFVPDDFVCKMSNPFPEEPASLQDRVLIRGAKLPLVDKTQAWKMPPGGLWSNVQPIDLDADGYLDVLVGDDFGVHRFLRNEAGKFVAYATDIGFHAYGHAMGWGIGDFNGDQLPDLALADAGPNPVYVQQAQPPKGKPVGFVDEGGARGVWGPTWTASTWSPVVADFDHDGRDDILLGESISTPYDAFPKVAAGCLAGGDSLYAGHPNPDVLFLSAGSGAHWTAYALPSGPYSHFAMVAHQVIDLDGDGDLDVVQARPNAGMTSMIRVLRNDVPKLGGSLVVKVEGKDGNRDAIGTVVRATIGGAVRTRWLLGSGGTGGTRTRMAHFGLGAAGKATAVKVLWPNGGEDALGEVGAGQTKAAVWE